MDMEQTYFGIDIALPCGLIINELVTNSLKHAFPSGREGIIEVSLKTDKFKKKHLVVRDNGIGSQIPLQNEASNTLGVMLVDMLTSQLEGTCNMKFENGAEVEIVFS